MNLSQSPLVRLGNHDGRPLIVPCAAPAPVAATYRNRERSTSAERDAKILKVIRSFRRFARFNDIYQRVQGSRSYLEERLRVMVADGRVLREPINGKDFIYRAAP